MDYLLLSVFSWSIFFWVSASDIGSGNSGSLVLRRLIQFGLHLTNWFVPTNQHKI
jgi:surface polysaccharide O-acyltransferase-like enzyme